MVLGAAPSVTGEVVSKQTFKDRASRRTCCFQHHIRICGHRCLVTSCRASVHSISQQIHSIEGYGTTTIGNQDSSRADNDLSVVLAVKDIRAFIISKMDDELSVGRLLQNVMSITDSTLVIGKLNSLVNRPSHRSLGSETSSDQEIW